MYKIETKEQMLCHLEYMFFLEYDQREPDLSFCVFIIHEFIWFKLIKSNLFEC